jgi:hypothetical protein
MLDVFHCAFILYNDTVEVRVSLVSVFEVKIEMKMRMKIEMRELEISKSHQLSGTVTHA